MSESKEMLQAAAQLEKDISKLYLLYSELFPSKKDFWRQLAKEEVEHSVLIEMAIDYPNIFPYGLADSDLSNIQAMSKDILKKSRNTKKIRLLMKSRSVLMP